ncbi:hypothetical protein E4L95_21095 [Paracoccus liaowanqingii]|uniref:Uncharacterized protein n=1 Tax=Paracoccus liaowanqingii TaxID=2560053 RepID=A0A4Z1C8P9_9RHOB|nr:hypothetical protein [Paracoccus liaowanqingii]TGN42589.1 hypothetical protein E4L95_21095 [Paracoccus liaowanqingii]
MLAFRLVVHALRQLWGNRGATLRLSLLPGLLWLAFTAGPMLLARTPQLRVEGGKAVPLVAAGLLGIILYVVMAVAWHRHILLDEPARLSGDGRRRQVLAYLGRMGMIMLAVVPALIAAVVLLSMLLTVAMQSGGQPAWIAAIAFVISVLLTALLLRLLTVLPGAALRHSRPWGAAWAATKGRALTFLLLGLVMTGAQTLLPNVTGLVATASLTLAVLVHAVLSWVGALIALSLMTTLWGHFVEGRALR